MVNDSRFDTSQWDAGAASSSASALLPEASPSDDEASCFEDEDEEDVEAKDGDEIGELNDGGDDDFDDEDADDDADADAKVVKPLTKKELEAYQKKQRKKGIIYISSIPHGMTPPKVRHLLGGFGDIERIYLHDGTQGKFGQEESKRRSSAHYTEGWVEFSKKRVAKAVAEVLNAQPIGTALVAAGVKMPRGSGAAGSSSKNAGGARRWKDHVWTMKYLPGFKWNMLTEQMAAERASRTARLRTELAQSALEQKDYLQKVERARIMREKESRREKRKASSVNGFDASASGTAAGAEAEGRDDNRTRTFKQRAPLLTDVRDQGRSKRGHEDDGTEGQKKRRKEGAEDARGKQALDSVLGSIF